MSTDFTSLIIIIIKRDQGSSGKITRMHNDKHQITGDSCLCYSCWFIEEIIRKIFNKMEYGIYLHCVKLSWLQMI